MKVKPIAADSLGVRSMATFIQTNDVAIFIDPWAALGPYRYGLGPAQVERQALRNAKARIENAAKKADTFIISHYHFDHHDPDVKFFEGTLSVSLSGNPADGVIRYTTDGSEPGNSAAEFTGAIEINTSTIFRARIFKESHLPGKVYSYNYIDLDDIDADNIPVIAISTDPYNLYNNSDGLFDERPVARFSEEPEQFGLVVVAHNRDDVGQGG